MFIQFETTLDPYVYTYTSLGKTPPQVVNPIPFVTTNRLSFRERL